MEQINHTPNLRQLFSQYFGCVKNMYSFTAVKELVDEPAAGRRVSLCLMFVWSRKSEADMTELQPVGNTGCK